MSCVVTKFPFFVIFLLQMHADVQSVVSQHPWQICTTLVFGHHTEHLATKKTYCICLKLFFTVPALFGVIFFDKCLVIGRKIYELHSKERCQNCHHNRNGYTLTLGWFGERIRTRFSLRGALLFP